MSDESASAFGVRRRRTGVFRLKAPVVLEHPLQEAICKTLSIELAPPGRVSRDGVVWWSVDHANYAGEVPGARIGRGCVAGIPDVFLLYRGRAYFIEIKTEAPHSRMSDEQCLVATAILAGGGRVGIARDLGEVLECLDNWNLPRARRVRL